MEGWAEPLKDGEFTIEGEKHNITEYGCDGCYGNPRPCECGGLIHSIIIDEDSDGEIVIAEKCDKCGQRGADD